MQHFPTTKYPNSGADLSERATITSLRRAWSAAYTPQTSQSARPPEQPTPTKKNAATTPRTTQRPEHGHISDRGGRKSQQTALTNLTSPHLLAANPPRNLSHHTTSPPKKAGSAPKTSNHGHPPPPPLRHPPRATRQHHQPPRKLLYEILPLPRALLAPALLRRRRRRAPAEVALRPAPHRGLCAREDGGGARGWRAAWAYYEFERYEDASEVGDCGEVDEAGSKSNGRNLPIPIRLPPRPHVQQRRPPS
ncbi:hypothetical protein V496_04739, partial [Pseudogymnoascus sp. VKM F-4515 (FW-2607)]